MQSSAPRTMKPLLISIVLALVGIYLVLCTGLYLAQERLLFFPEVLPSDFTFTFPQRFDEVSLPVDGATLHTLHFRGERPKGVILYLHGNAGSVRSWGAVADEFLAHGYEVLLPDYRGYGKSSGTIRGEADLHADAAAAYAYLVQHYPESAIVVYGRSIGTGLAVQLATTRQPRLLILETPYFNLQELAMAQFPLVPSVLLKYPLRTDRWIGTVTCPVYLLHGTQDELIPYSASVRLLPLIRSPHQLFTIDGGGHNNLRTFRQYHEALAQILG